MFSSACRGSPGNRGNGYAQLSSGRTTPSVQARCSRRYAGCRSQALQSRPGSPAIGTKPVPIAERLVFLQLHVLPSGPHSSQRSALQPAQVSLVYRTPSLRGPFEGGIPTTVASAGTADLTDGRRHHHGSCARLTHLTNLRPLLAVMDEVVNDNAATERGGETQRGQRGQLQRGGQDR
jgi:hypothetical protein